MVVDAPKRLDPLSMFVTWFLPNPAATKCHATIQKKEGPVGDNPKPRWWLSVGCGDSFGLSNHFPLKLSLSESFP